MAPSAVDQLAQQPTEVVERVLGRTDRHRRHCYGLTVAVGASLAPTLPVPAVLDLARFT